MLVRSSLITIYVLLLTFNMLAYAYADNKSPQTKEPNIQPADSTEQQIIHAFTSQDDSESEIITIADKEKRLVMFVMGVPLLIFIFITAGLGIAMGVYGKDVFVAHMIFAGLSLTLALGHAIVGLVWFFPF